VNTVSDKLVNASWSARKSIIDAKYKADQKAIKKFLYDGITKQTKNPITLATWKTQIDGYMNWDWGKKVPSDDEQLELSSAAAIIKVVAIAKWGENHYLKHQSQWNSQAAKTNYEEQISATGEGERAQPEFQGAKEDGIAQMYSGYNNDEASVKRSKRIGDAFANMLMPEDRDTFDPRTSISYDAYVAKLKENKKWKDFAIRTVVEKPYYLMDSAELLESAMPGIFDPRSKRYIGCSAVDMNKWFVAQRKLYDDKTLALMDRGVSLTSGDKYDSVMKKYYKDMEKMMAAPAATPFKQGIAGRYLQSYLTDPKAGREWDKNFAQKILTEMKRDNPNFDSLIATFDAGDRRQRESQTANAWASICVSAIYFQKTIAHARDKHSGESDGGVKDTQDHATRRLYEYIGKWKRYSRWFLDSWNEQGGDTLIELLLKEGS
jgi:hypothetical protein